MSSTFKNTHLRPIKKTISYRLLSMLVTFIISTVVTGSITIGATLGILDFIIKFGLYYFHELWWNRDKK